jgi:hypothetical protein
MFSGTLGRVGSMRRSKVQCLPALIARRAPKGAKLRNFASTAITIKPPGPSVKEQTLFVVGLNRGKFFGQDGAEEGLKLLERVADHSPEYSLLFGLTEQDLDTLEEEYVVQGSRLTPSRELVAVRNGEFVPMVQAAMVDKRPRQALARPLRTTQGHVAWRLWKNPSECLRLFKLVRRRKEFKDAALYKFWSENLPLASQVYFAETADLIAIRTVEHLIANRQNGVGGCTILIVNSELFGVLVERLKSYVADDATLQIGDPKLSEQLQKHAMDLTKDVPDMTPLLVLIYLGIPLLALHQLALFCEYLYTFRLARPDSGQEYDLVTGNRE